MRSDELISCDFSCNQAALWMVLSIFLSITQCFCHCIIMKFSGIMKSGITIDKSEVRAKGQGQRSRSQRWKQILPQFGHCRTLTPVWIHRWLQNDVQSLEMAKKRCPNVFFRSSVKYEGHIGRKIDDLDLIWARLLAGCKYQIAKTYLVFKLLTYLDCVMCRCVIELVPCWVGIR